MSMNPYESPGAIPVPSKVGGIARKLAYFATGAILLFCVVGMFFPARRFAPEAGRRALCINNLKNIALALETYKDVYHAYPPAYTVDAAGNRLHSWRTLVLPYLDRNDLYRRIDFSKPWNDPVNRAAYEEVMPIYQCPGEDLPPGHTTYLAVVAPHGVFQGMTGRVSDEIVDGSSLTLLVVEVESERHIHWMSPEDTDLDWLLRLDEIDELPHKGVNMAFADGRVTHLDRGTSKERLRALVTIAGGDNDVARDE